MIDLHAHILPGLDDGPPDMETALAMCRIAVEQETTLVVATPHMLDGTYDVSREQVLDGVRALQAELDERRIALKIAPGADVRIAVDLSDQLRHGTVMTVADGGKYVMVELPQDVLPQRLSECFFSVQLLGLTPIISHPERNYEVQNHPELLNALAESGNVIQITAASLLGRFGEAAAKCAHELLARRLAHVVASDAHSPDRRPPGLAEARRAVEDVLPSAEIEEVFVRRPQRIVEGQYVELPEPCEGAAARRRRWFPW